jgi:hypothetical protein
METLRGTLKGPGTPVPVPKDYRRPGRPLVTPDGTIVGTWAKDRHKEVRCERLDVRG